MRYLTVVRNVKTGKILPFKFVGQNNEVEIISSGVYNIDDYVISSVKVTDIDWENMYITEGEYFG